MVLQDHPACQYDQGDVSIDTLSFTIDLAIIAELSPMHWQMISSGLEAPETNENFFLWHAFQTTVDQIFGKDVFRLADKFSTGRNFFRNSIALENKAGFLAFGGNNNVINFKGESETKHERIQFYISGEGCRQVPDWQHVYRELNALAEFNPKITRIDIAYDDLEGRRDVDYARDSYTAGLFAGNGRPPKGQYIDDMGSADGRTFYVGSRDSGRYLRVYEKGRQLGDKASNWVRWEVELSAKQCDIPLRALVDYRHYLAGSYPCLDWIDNARLTIEAKKKREKIEYQHLVSHGRRAYGALVNYMLTRRKMTTDQVVAELVRDGLPGRLVWTTQEHVEPESRPHSDKHPHLYPEIHTVNPPCAAVIDYEQKAKSHWSNI